MNGQSTSLFAECVTHLTRLFYLQGIEKIRSDLERSESLRKTAATKENDSLERLKSQIQAEQKLKSGHFLSSF